MVITRDFGPRYTSSILVVPTIMPYGVMVSTGNSKFLCSCSNRDRATMTTFIYNGVTIETPNLEKKLKRMKITLDDITIIPNKVKEEPKEVLDDSITIHRFDNIINGDYIIGVSESLDHLIWDPTNKTGIRDFDPNNWRRIY